MMWIVRLALRRPYTFVVFALLILILGVFSIESMPTDIFPNIDIPVVTVVWNYAGLSADQIANRIVTNAERGMTTTVNDIDHIESQSLVGVGIIKVFFHPNVNIAQAVAEISAISAVQIRSLPPGTFPPFIIQYNASSVPVLQLGISGQGLNEQQLNDMATNTIRIQLATVEGAQTPFPFGGKQRQIEVDLDLNALQARGLSPTDVVSAIAAQNVIAPSGTIKLDRFEYQVETNSAPTLLETLNNVPVKTVNGTIVYMHDVAHGDSKGQYFWVWGALLVLTAIEVVLGYKQIFAPVRMLEALLILSVIKSALIIGYFMHLKFETALMRWLLVISVAACFVIMYFFFFPDAGRILQLGVK